MAKPTQDIIRNSRCYCHTGGGVFSTNAFKLQISSFQNHYCIISWTILHYLEFFPSKNVLNDFNHLAELNNKTCTT